jgi:hypothetical protein
MKNSMSPLPNPPWYVEPEPKSWREVLKALQAGTHAYANTWRKPSAESVDNKGEDPAHTTEDATGTGGPAERGAKELAEALRKIANSAGGDTKDMAKQIASASNDPEIHAFVRSWVETFRSSSSELMAGFREGREEEIMRK